MSPPLSIGIIGTGIGRMHARGAVDIPGVSIGAICDLDIERARALAAELEIEPLVTDDWRALLNCGLDAVSVCVPNFGHARIAIACLDAGLHVLCEKPLATDAAGAQLIADAAARSGKHCMVGQVLRFRDDVCALKKRAGEIGRPYYARALARRASGIPKWGSWFTQRDLSGGGPLIDTGVHIIDLAWWLAGSPRPLSASATTYDALGTRKIGLGMGGIGDAEGIFDVEDLAAGMIRFEGDFSIHFEASWALYAAGDARLCHVHGTEGALLWNDEPKIVGADGTIEALPGEAGDAWHAEMEEFVGSIRENRAPKPSALAGVTMMKMLDALYQSAREGREVEVA